MLPPESGLYRHRRIVNYLKASLLLSGPLVLIVGISQFSYNKLASIRLAQEEWNRYAKERNNALDLARAKAKADQIKNQQETRKLQASIENSRAYFADIPAVLRSSDGATLVNFGKLINGETALYSYKVTIGQAIYDVQGELRAQGNTLYYSDNYNKSDSEVISEGEVRHEKDQNSGILRLTFLTSKNIGPQSRLGDIRIFSFKYN